MSERIVAVGLLTSHDLEVLGTGFTRHFAVPDDDAFGDLLDQLNRIKVVPADDRRRAEATSPGPGGINSPRLV
jgi:hypothetical protein